MFTKLNNSAHKYGGKMKFGAKILRIDWRGQAYNGDILTT